MSASSLRSIAAMDLGALRDAAALGDQAKRLLAQAETLSAEARRLTAEADRLRALAEKQAHEADRLLFSAGVVSVQPARRKTP